MIGDGSMGWAELAARMSHRPVAIAGVAARHGRRLEVGAPANLCLVESGGSWVVDPDERYSRSGNTPFAGQRFSNRVVATVLRGSVTHQLTGASTLPA